VKPLLETVVLPVSHNCASKAVEVLSGCPFVFVEFGDDSYRRAKMTTDNMARVLRPRNPNADNANLDPHGAAARQVRVQPPAIVETADPQTTGNAKPGKPQYPCIEITPRSVWIGSRRTSIRLEPEFWTALGEISREQRSTISGVLLDIERIHGRSRFASKVRVAILAYYRR
jgi:predicted DNA-binding ribbon-helix-helix protein